MTGSLPDANLSLDFTELVGKLRQQANIASRSGQMADLEHLADEMRNWERRLRRAITLALGEGELVHWTTVVNRITEVRHERDGAQQVSMYNADQLREYDRQFTELREELDAARREARP